jgi:8-oxo-dGTP pyrophosphatase MutT (NUDIX family)
MQKGTVCFFKNDNKILLGLIEYGKNDKKWNGFGGVVNENESVPDALIRELYEELDITINEERLTKSGIVHYPNIELHVFLVNNFDQDVAVKDPTIKKVQWFNKNDIPYSEMFSKNNEWLPKVLEGMFVEKQY